ncbi:hypothetical protein PIB30_104761, partial [Stylosanthes scabra]|nr:hypothetical protein [Stylosanthes scabra]
RKKQLNMLYYYVSGPELHGLVPKFRDAQQNTTINPLESGCLSLPIKLNKYLRVSERMVLNKTDKNTEQQTGTEQVMRDKRRITWRPPPKGWIKCNFDAAFHNDQKLGSISIVFRNEEGKIIIGSA